MTSSIKNNAASSSSPSNGGDDDLERRNKRRKVAEPCRKRVAKACTSCRRLKEKCDGKNPCSRCIRYARPCGPISSPVKPTINVSLNQQENIDERLAHLETIASHFLGAVPKDNENLRRTVAQLGKSRSPDDMDENESVSGKAPAFVKLSDLAFARQLHNEIGKRLNAQGAQLLSPSGLNEAFVVASCSNSNFDRESLPPKDVGLFLCHCYFDFAQTTTTWVEQPWVEARLEQLYSSVLFSTDDHPWMCSLLAVMAIGVEFAHLADESAVVPESDINFNNTACRELYQTAVQLLQDVLRLPGLDSIQAFLLLANLSLTWHDSGSATRYLALADHMAAQIRLQSHRTLVLGVGDASLSRFETIIQTWSKRISVFHGTPLPRSGWEREQSAAYVSKSEWDVQQQQISPQSRNNLFTLLSGWLEMFSQATSILEHCDHTHNAACIERLLKIRNAYREWWSQLGLSQIPILQMNRHTAPLHICYNLNLVFIGRFLIFRSFEDQEPPTSIASENAIAELVDDAEYSAYEVIDICSMLDKSTGLTAAQYVETHACRVALLVMFAQSLIGRCHLFRGKLQQGLELLRKVTKSSSTCTSEMFNIESLAAALDRLAPHTRNQKYKTTPSSSVGSSDGYMRLRSWAAKKLATQSSNADDMESLLEETYGNTNTFEGLFGQSVFDQSLFAFNPVGDQENELCTTAY